MAIALFVVFFYDTATTEIYTLSLHDALPIFGDQQLHVPPEFQRAIPGEALDRGQVVRFLASSTLVETLDGRVFHGGRVEALERAATGLGDARRLVLEPGLVRHHLARLRRPIDSV